MESFFREKISYCFNTFKNKVIPKENYQIIEKKRKIYYFSKFSLDIEEFLKIYSMIRTIKENVSKNVLNNVKKCIEEIVVFNSEKNEREKILIIFTICYLHFYSNFSYENTFSFEDYFNQNLINLCTKYKVYVSDIKKFKVFCYSFYHELIKEMSNFKYEEYKLLYKFYNPSNDYQDQNQVFVGSLNKINFIDLFQSYFNKLRDGGSYIFTNLVKKDLYKPLIITTERVVDMVMSIENENNESNENGNKDRLESDSLFNSTFDKLKNRVNGDKLTESIKESIDNKIISDKSSIKDSSSDLNFLDNTTEATDISNSNIKNTSKISKRILSELIKSDVDEYEKNIVYDISDKLDYLIEILLNKCENKIYFIQMFICYIIEINSELIKLLPEFSNLKHDINLRYIISSKNIYNYAIEVYFSIHDLYNIDLNTFMEIFSKKFPLKFDENIAKHILSFYKIITNEIIKINKNSIREILQNVFESLINIWDKVITEKGQELTRFYSL